MNIVYAQNDTTKYQLLESIDGATEVSVTGADKFEYFSKVYNVALTIVVALAVVMIVIAGVQYTLAWSSPSAKQEAWGRIMGAVGGLVLALFSVLILQTINPNLVTPSLDLTVVPSTGGGGGASSKCTGPSCYTEDQARALLEQYKIGVKDVCPSGQTVNCVRLDGVRQETLVEAVWIKENCKCDVYITSATEPNLGQSTGHLNGYKIDIRPNPELDAWIQTNMRPAGKLSGYDIWVDDKIPGGTGAGWMRENTPGNDHWDMDIRGAQNSL